MPFPHYTYIVIDTYEVICTSMMKSFVVIYNDYLSSITRKIVYIPDTGRPARNPIFRAFD